jgi:parallel beta-helix repeat protein
MKQISRISRGVIFICIFLPVFFSYATTYYVSKSGADESGRDGSSSEPWLTIGYAVERAEVGTGDVIEVGDGVYEENIPIYKSITLQGATAPSPPSIVGAVLGGPGTSGGHFDLRANDITVDGFTFDAHAAPGIGAVNSTSGHTITNNYFYKRGRGVFFGDGSEACTITNNTIDQSGECGLFIGGTGGHTIQGNTILNSGDHAIDIRNSVTTTVTINNGNQITGNTNNGISISGPATVDGNTITGNGANGISIDGNTTGVTVSNNTQIDNNGEHGIKVYGSATISGNTIHMNNNNGVYVTCSATIDNNTITNNQSNGIETEDNANNLVINNNQIEGNNSHGVLLRATATLEGNTIDSNGQNGISSTDSAVDVQITNNNQISNNVEHGIFIEPGGSATIQNNNIDNNCSAVTQWEYFAGICVGGSATVSENTIENNAGSGIVVASTASSVTISNNSAVNGNREGISIQGPATVNNNNVINNNTYQGIEVAASASNVTVDGNTMESNDWAGISTAEGASNITIENNDISGNVRGVYGRVGKFRDNTIEDNTDVGVVILNASIDLGQDNDAEAGNNIIRNNTNWNVVNMTENAVSAYRNYWGLADAAAIDATIEDDDEDGSLGPVNFDPFLTEEPTAVDFPVTEQTPEFTRIILAYPNPFNPTTIIEFVLSHNSHIQIAVHDLLGRQVKCLADKQVNAGQYKIIWDTTNDQGQKVAAGFYFCRMEADDFIDVIKLMFVK